MLNFLRSAASSLFALLLVISFNLQAGRTIMVNNRQISTGQVYELSALMNNRTSSDEFYAIVDAADRVLLDFYASWCPPCKRTAPHFEALAQENKNVFFIKINVEEFKALCRELGVKNLPTFISFDKGQEVARFSKGALSKNELKKLSRIL